MPQGYRPDRVADQIRAEISVMLAREVHDPGIGFMTITRVQVSPDLQLARVYYTTLGSEAQRWDTAKALLRAIPFLRRQIGQRLKLRRVPVLEFFFDKSVENQERVERLIHEIHEADATAEADVARDEPNHDPERDTD
jgi:ribosome-binding factor A